MSASCGLHVVIFHCSRSGFISSISSSSSHITLHAMSTDAQNTQQTPTSSTGPADAAPAAGDQDYPEQKHAGAVGLGPNYKRGPVRPPSAIEISCGHELMRNF
jgi:hypothetical protein